MLRKVLADELEMSSIDPFQSGDLIDGIKYVQTWIFLG
jgi:hypothetical protein